MRKICGHSCIVCRRKIHDKVLTMYAPGSGRQHTWAQLNWVHNTSTKKFSSTVDSFGLSQMVETPTHRAGHTLDIVLVRRDRSEGVSISVQPPVISDHSVITIQLPICRPPPNSFSATTRPWKILTERLSADDELSEAYSSVLTSIVDRLAPRIVVRKHFHPITPWFNVVCRAEKPGHVVSNESTDAPG